MLSIRNLRVRYEVLSGTVYAVNGVDLSIPEGCAHGLVGETGAGKTTTALSILGMVPRPPGVVEADGIEFMGRDVRSLGERELENLRGGNVSMIFQDPMGSLNPIYTAGSQIAEVVRLHRKVRRAEAKQIALEMLAQVGLPAASAERYPHELSGGMRQRVMIAIALACSPKLLIADEPTTALDVTIQAQVMEIMKSLKRRYASSMLLITHELGLVAEICDRVSIMYAGRIMESGSVADVFNNPRHPYTIGLFESTPQLNKKKEVLQPIDGLSPDPRVVPPGCPFYGRCPRRLDRCDEKFPGYRVFPGGHRVACERWEA